MVTAEMQDLNERLKRTSRDMALVVSRETVKMRLRQVTEELQKGCSCLARSRLICRRDSEGRCSAASRVSKGFAGERVEALDVAHSERVADVRDDFWGAPYVPWHRLRRDHEAGQMAGRRKNTSAGEGKDPKEGEAGSELMRAQIISPWCNFLFKRMNTSHHYDFPRFAPAPKKLSKVLFAGDDAASLPCTPDESLPTEPPLPPSFMGEASEEASGGDSTAFFAKNAATPFGALRGGSKGARWSSSETKEMKDLAFLGAHASASFKKKTYTSKPRSTNPRSFWAYALRSSSL